MIQRNVNNLFSISKRHSPLHNFAYGLGERVEALGGGVAIEQFINPNPIAWIEEHFYIPETRGPIVLYPHQRQTLETALTRTIDGLFPYSTIIYSDIKKSAKSTITAAVVLWLAFQVEWGSIYVVANDLKQADSRVFYYLRRAIELHPVLRSMCTIRNYKITLPNKTFIEAIPIDPTGEAGSNADMVVFSELWGAHSKAQERMWTEMTLPPTKFGHSFRWIETYAGFEGESPLLERLYGQIVKDDYRIDDEVELYANPEARMFALWNTQPRLPWQSPEYYASEEFNLDASEFLRVHRNQWSSGSTERFIDIALWDRLKEELPPLTRREPAVAAADAGVKSDLFAFTIVTRHPSPKRRADSVAVRLTLTWTPPKDGELDFDEIELEIVKVCRQYNIIELIYDPYQLHQMMTKLMRKYGIPTREMSQGLPRLIADKTLLDLIIQARLAHNGDPLLRQHIDNANRKLDKSSEDKKLRLVKRHPNKKIDLAVTTAMAAYRCLELPL